MKGKFKEEQAIIDKAVAKKDKIPIEVRKFLSHFICNNLIPIIHRDMLSKELVDNAVASILETMNTIGVCTSSENLKEGG